MEFSTELGDILVFGIDEVPREIYKAVDLRRFAQEQGGVMIAAHPFRYDLSPKPWLRAVEADLTLEKACRRQIFQLVDAIEVVNGWATQQDVDFTLRVCAHLGLKGTGGSDAHAPEEVGLCVTVFDDRIACEADLVVALKSGRFRAEDRRQPNQKKPTKYGS